MRGIGKRALVGQPGSNWALDSEHRLTDQAVQLSSKEVTSSMNCGGGQLFVGHERLVGGSGISTSP